MNLTIFSSYPRAGQTHDEKIVGGASYTKTLVTHLTRYFPKLKLTVYAESFAKQAETYHEQNATIHRIWKRNDIFSVFQAILHINRSENKKVVVSYEVNMVGGPFANMVFLLALLLLKVSGKTLYFIPHQVVEDFRPLERNVIKARILNVLKNILFFYIALIADKVIVFEEYFVKLIPFKHKAFCVPLAIEELPVMDTQTARNELKLNSITFHFLFFGFLSPYKGLEDFLTVYDSTHSSLLVAGDGNPNHLNKKWYRSYVLGLKTRANQAGANTIGFIPETAIPAYYAACDAVILPYRIFFSSSFPLSLAMSYNKPILLSPALAGYFESADFREALEASGLTKNDLIMTFDKADITAKMEQITKHKPKYEIFAKTMKRLRGWESVSRRYMEVFELL